MALRPSAGSGGSGSSLCRQKVSEFFLSRVRLERRRGMTDPTHAKQEPRRGFGIMNNRPSTLRESASDPTSKPTVIVPDDRGHSITVLLCPCTRVEREKEKQDMLLSDTAPDAPKHDVISSPTDTFGVISSGAVWAAAGVRLRVRHTRQTDALAHLASSHMATCNSPISQRPTRNEVRIVSSQLSASSTMEQGPEIFEVQPLLPHSASKRPLSQVAHCAVEKGPRPFDIAISGDAGLCGSAPRELRDRCIQALQSGKRPSSTVQHRVAAAPTNTVRRRDDGFCWMLDCAADSPMA